MIVEEVIVVRKPRAFLGAQAQDITTAANQFPSTDIFFEFGDRRHRAKSLLGLFSLGIREGDTLTVIADAPDEKTAKAAIEAMNELIA